MEHERCFGVAAVGNTTTCTSDRAKATPDLIWSHLRRHVYFRISSYMNPGISELNAKLHLHASSHMTASDFAWYVEVDGFSITFYSSQAFLIGDSV